MNQQTISQLNAINQNFYTSVGKEFDETRQQPWEGWNQLLQYFPKKSDLKILDIGCGNGRFAQFLIQKPDLNVEEYIGIDNNQFLLKQAKNTVQNKNFTFKEIDIVEGNFSFLNEKKFDLIVLFGVLHHIPSFELRKSLFEKVSEYLAPGGVFIFSAWQFLSIPALKQRLVQWEMFPQIEFDQLEQNDFLVDWRRGTNAYRYCHFVNEKEIQKLLPLHLMKVRQFYADGKNERSNLYSVVKKE